MPKPKKQPITTSGIMLQHFGKVVLALGIGAANIAAYDLITPDNDNGRYSSSGRECNGAPCITVRRPR